MKSFAILFAALVCGLVAACRKEAPPPAAAVPAHHEHKAPHGGTAVELGHDEYHLELLLDPATGSMQAYVMDGELEEYVRIAAPSFEIIAKRPAGAETLVFHAVPNRATGETVGDTSCFTAQAEWLKAEKTFDAVLKELTVKGSVYQNVGFNFPKGNDADVK